TGKLHSHPTLPNEVPFQSIPGPSPVSPEKFLNSSRNHSRWSLDSNAHQSPLHFHLYCHLRVLGSGNHNSSICVSVEINTVTSKFIEQKSPFLPQNQLQLTHHNVRPLIIPQI
ncbi:unnamed protein product, partial [Tenebrio molitor]